MLTSAKDLPHRWRCTGRHFLHHSYCVITNFNYGPRTSAQNCAWIYNEDAQSRPWHHHILLLNGLVSCQLNYELVTESFVINALLNWHHDCGTLLQVPHSAVNQAERWHGAVNAQNLAMAGTGQPAWNHACNLCTKLVYDCDQNPIKAYRSVVTDGISMGHPCCAVHNCKEPLKRNNHVFCAQHSHLQGKCAVETCEAPIEPNFRTCTIPSHQNAEAQYFERGK